MKHSGLLWGSILLLWVDTSCAQGTPAGKLTCAIKQFTPSDADKALVARRFDEAEKLYRTALQANPNSPEPMVGLVRAAIGQEKLPEALTLATKFDAAHPNTPMLLDALGEVRFRRGEVYEAALSFNASHKLDPCLALTYLEISRFLNLSGMYATAQRQLEMAHTLAPDDPEIRARWQYTHATPPSAEVRLAMLKARLADPSINDEQREGINAAIKGIETREKGSCELVSPVTEVKLPIVPISKGMAMTQQAMYGAGLDVLFNGKRKRLQIDTGATGLLLSRSVAKSAGLVPELEFKASGIGDSGPRNAFVTHVDDIRIGSMEFKNCMVRVLESSDVLDVDGLIGPDVFRDYLVTLDVPGREVRIGPLPKRPDEQPATKTALETDPGATTEGPRSMAELAKDRYVAPEMENWQRVFRYDHFLIVPTMIGKAPVKLFILDTGASHSMISPAAAREVTSVSGNDAMHIKGISGEVKNVLMADNVAITFAGVKQVNLGMDAYNSALLSHSSGVEISGLIGFPMLRELVISIDYRDNLVKVVYDPKKGYHAH